MIRQTLTTDTTIESDIEWLNSQDEMLYDIGYEIKDEIEPYLIGELSSSVNPVKHPIEWTSDRQRRAFYATNGFGGGIPYQRTGTLRESWTLSLIEDGNGFRLVVENSAPQAKFVYGSLAQNRTDALRFQQRFHANTGWQAATDTVNFWFDAGDELLEQKLDDRIKEQVNTRRRAYTKGTRK